MTWADSNYGYKKKITIDKDKVNSTCSNFPALVSVTDSDLADTGNGGYVEKSGGWDIVFYNSAEDTLLAHEIESYTNTNGELEFYVKIPSVSSSVDTDFYIYFGYSSCPLSYQGAGTQASTWDSDFLAVWHLTDLDDSTGSHDLTNDGASTSSSGKIGGCYDFDAGSPDKIVHGSFLDIFPTDITAEIWVKRDVASTWDELWSKWNDSETNRMVMVLRNTNQLRVFGGDGRGSYDEQTTGTIDTNWHYLVVTGDDTGSIILYIDDTEEDENGTYYKAGNNQDNNDFTIGARFNDGNPFDGKLDEIRFSQIVRSSGWLMASFNNQDSPGDFMSWGSLETDTELFTPSDTAKATDSPVFDAEILLTDQAKSTDSPIFDAEIPISDTAKALDSPAFKPKLPISDTAKALDSPVFDAEIPISDIAKATDSVSYNYGNLFTPSDLAKATDSLIASALTQLSDLAKATDSPEFNAEIPLTDLAKATDIFSFKPKIPFSDLAKALDSIQFKAGFMPGDNAKALDSIKANAITQLGDIAKASDSVSYSYSVVITTPTENLSICR